MNNIYFIQPYNNQTLNIKNIEVISLKSKPSDDFQFEDFIDQHLPKTPIDTLIIPVRLWENDSDNSGLYLALHIRLTKTYKNRFVPITFTSNETKEEILSSQIAEGKSHSAMLLFTKSCQVVEWDLGKITHAVNNVSDIIADEKDFLENVYPHLIIDKARNVGNHSLANKWGILQLAKAANIDENSIISKYSELQKFRSNLYVKYLLAKSSLFNKNRQNQGTSEALDTQKEKKKKGEDWKEIVKDKKILLIDDEAEKGWATVLEKIFEGAIIHIETSYDYDSFSHKTKIENNEYDLYLLDLRLNPTEEEKPEFIQRAKTTEYSGAKILQEIKTQNPGNQVIVFTASNKAWNLKELMQAGYEADGYYMKESPDFYFDADFSQKNFENLKNEAEKCFEKGYLRKMYKEIEIIKGDINTLNPYNAKSSHVNEFNKCKIEILIQLDIAFRQIKLVQVNNDFPYAFICFFQILEILQKENFLVYMRDILFKNRIQVNAYQINKQNQFVQAGDEDSIFSIIVSISKELDINDNNLFWALHYDIQRRHKFIHKEISQDIEFQKIYTSTATVELWGRIKTILEKLPLSPIP